MKKTATMQQSLPIWEHIPEIIDLVKANQVTIIATPTGSGKTLVVPTALQRQFKTNVWVTVPRVLLAKSAQFAAANLIHGKDSAVGLKTGKGDKHPCAKIQYCTEGSFCARVLKNISSDDIIVIDEIHEQGINTEEVVYLAKNHLNNGGKVVLKSATMDVKKYSNFFASWTVASFEMAQPKRPFETEILVVNDPLAEIVAKGGRWLVGCGGKAEIAMLTMQFQKNGWKGKIFPLHGEIEEWEEKEAMSYTKGDCLYIATSIAMSGITFPNLDGVLVPHSGKRVEGSNLIEYPLSKAEQKQWEGRVGRTQKGTAIYNTSTALYRDRDENVTPEILRTPTRNSVLSFAAKGYDLAKIELLNQPPIENVEKSKAELTAIGLLEDSIITPKGMVVSNLGLGLDGGLFAYSGQKLGVEATARKIAAIVESGTPYRKGATRFGRNLAATCALSKVSDHYRTLRMVEDDTEQHFGGGAIAEIVRKYGVENNIFLKGVGKLLKQFQQIDKQYRDHATITPEILKELFKQQSPNFKFDQRSNAEYGYITGGHSTLSNLYGKCYATVSPITTRRGRIVEMVTELDGE